MISLKKFPPVMADIDVDLMHPNRALISGCFEEVVKVGDEQRKFISYLPENIEYCQQCIVVAPPAKCDALEYLEASGWKDIADKLQLFVFILMSKDGKWHTDGSDADYMNKVYVQIQARDYYITMQDNIYAYGDGDGAIIAQQATAKMTSEWSGLMTVGDITEKLDLAKGGSAKEEDQGGGELKVSAQKCQLPVWMVVSNLDGNNKAAVEYWQAENKTLPEYLSGQGADYIWMPTPVRMTNEVNEEQISQVRVTVSSAKAPKEIFEVMWKYIGLARRHRGFAIKNLRYFKNPLAYGAQLKEKVADGVMRRWYEYVPETCTPDKKWPLVIVMHGRGGTAETFFDISGMANVAKARNFIAVFPEASLYQQKKNGLRNVLLWDGFYKDKPLDDVKFIREMVDDIKSRLPVDSERIYACGQSSGGMMSDTLCEYASDIFAACAPWSLLRISLGDFVKHTPTKEITPTFYIVGDRDNTAVGDGTDKTFPFSVNEEIRDNLLAKIKRYGLDLKDVTSWQTYPITWYEYRNKEGVPLLTVGVVDNMVHANYPEESWISYDQFLCHFQRKSDGSLWYNGKKVNV